MKIITHLGLGDTIAIAPIIAAKARQYFTEQIQIPCWQHNYVSVKSFFALYPNVEVAPFKTESDMLVWSEDADIVFGHYKTTGLCKRRPDEDFVQWFYRVAGFDITQKTAYCPITKAAYLIAGNKFEGEYNFIHDDHSRGFIIEGIKGVRPYHDPKEFDGSILRYASSLIHAKEIHCIDSAFLHLVEALPVTGKLFYHKYARPHSTAYNCLKKNWTVLNEKP